MTTIVDNNDNKSSSSSTSTTSLDEIFEQSSTLRSKHPWDCDRLAKRRRRSCCAFCATASWEQPSGATSSLFSAAQHFAAIPSHWHSATLGTRADSARGVGVVTGSADMQEDNGTASTNQWGEGPLRDVSCSGSCNSWSPYNSASSDAELAATTPLLDGHVWSCPAGDVPLCPITPPADGAQMLHNAGPGGYPADVYWSVGQGSLHWVGLSFGEGLQHNPLTPPPDGIIEGYGTQHSPSQPYGAADSGLQTDHLH